MPIESPNLDDLRYDRVVEETIRRIPVHAPEWTDHNDSDPGITMIQLFASLAEQVGYRLNRVPEKNYIELLKLLGVRLMPAHAASTTLAFLLQNPSALTSLVLRAGTRAKAKRGTPPPSFETDLDLDLVPAEPVVLVTTKNPRLWDLLYTGATPDTITGDPPASPSPRSPWHAVVWDGRAPPLKDMPVNPVVLFPAAGQKYLWVGLDFNPARDAGFLGVRVTLSVQLDDDEQPKLGGAAFCGLTGLAGATPKRASRAGPTRPDSVACCDATGAVEAPPLGSEWLHYYDAAAGELRPVPKRVDDETQRLSRSGTIKFTVPPTLGAIPAANFVDLVPAVTPTPMEGCATLATALRTRIGTVVPAGDFIDLTGFQTALTGAITDAEAAVVTPAPPVPHPLDPSLRDPAHVRGWLRITVDEASPSPKLRIAVFNAVPATNARTVTSELLGISNGRPGQSFRLANRNVLLGTLELGVQEAPDQALVTWTGIDSFDTAGPNDRVFVLDAEAGTIAFGDGRRGRVPPLVPRAGGVIALRYRFGGGKAGEVDEGEVTVLESAPSGIAAVTNPLAARGGKDAETLEEAKIRARKELSTRTRAVTATDFEWIASQTPSVRVARVHTVPLKRPLACVDPRLANAGAQPENAGAPAASARTGCCGSTPSAAPSSSIAASRTPLSPGPVPALVDQRCGDPLPPGWMGLDDQTIAYGAVSVIGVPDVEGHEPLPTASFLRAICEQLNRHRLITTEVFVVPPQYFRICKLTAEVRAKPGYSRTMLQDLVGARLGRYFHVLTGGEDGKGFPFGAQIHIADLIAQVFRTEGIDRVESLSADFTRTKSNADPRQGRLVLCPAAAVEFEKVSLSAEENVSFDAESLLLTVVV